MASPSQPVTPQSAHTEHRPIGVPPDPSPPPPKKTSQVTRRILNFQGKAVPRHLAEQLAAMESVLVRGEAEPIAPAGGVAAGKSAPEPAKDRAGDGQGRAKTGQAA